MAEINQHLREDLSDLSDNAPTAIDDDPEILLAN